MLCLGNASRELPEFLGSLWVQSDSALELYEVFLDDPSGRKQGTGEEAVLTASVSRHWGG